MGQDFRARKLWDPGSLYRQNPHFSRKRKLDVLIRRKECLNEDIIMMTTAFTSLSHIFSYSLSVICFSSSTSLSNENGDQELATLIQILGSLFENTVLSFPWLPTLHFTWLFTCSKVNKSFDPDISKGEHWSVTSSQTTWKATPNLKSKYPIF